MDDNLVSEILQLLVSDLEGLNTLGVAFLSLAFKELAQGCSAGNFKEIRARHLRILDNMRNFIEGEPPLELLRYRAEAERAIEESDWDELQRLNEEFKRRLQE